MEARQLEKGLCGFDVQAYRFELFLQEELRLCVAGSVKDVIDLFVKTKRLGEVCLEKHQVLIRPEGTHISIRFVPADPVDLAVEPPELVSKVQYVNKGSSQ
jgi:hypothetical protein